MRSAAFSIPLLLVLLAAPVRLCGLERVVSQVYPVQPGAGLLVEAYRGAITVEESDAAEIRITVRSESLLSDERAAGAALDRLKVTMGIENNRVSVRVTNPTEKRVRFVWREDEQPNVTCTMSVPRQCSVDLTTSTGGIVVGFLTGRMKAQTETGTIFFRGVKGSVQATAGVGDVVVSHCSGDAVLTARRGTVRVGNVGGRAEVKAINGDIEIQSARGALTAWSEAGDISVGFARGRTEGADVRAAGGSIFAKIDATAHCLIAASSDWGRVESTLPLAIDGGGSGKKKLSGRLNQGGPLLTLRASGGHVKIDPATDLVE